ncbi:zinc transporter ZIP1 isoform X2 [Prinia subflava]|uniref:zinc transporter ZIP1 isoform X2 n=1 Tax=Prinia subflava TaxID=208062 RepID=UPI002FE1BABD
MNPLRPLLGVPRPPLPSPAVPPPPPGAGAGHQDLRDPGEPGQVPPRAGKGRDHPSPSGARGPAAPPGHQGRRGGEAAPVPGPGGLTGEPGTRSGLGQLRCGRRWLWTGAGAALPAAPLPGDAQRGSELPRRRALSSGSTMDTGAALAWSPGAASQPPPGLGVKLGSLVLLLLLPLACGLAPLWCFRQPPDPRSPVLSLVSCFSGGVFMGTFLLDLLPDYLGSIAAALEGLRITLQFPLPEFILAMGFFLVLVLEQATLAQRELAEPPEESRALLLPNGSIQAAAPGGAGGSLGSPVPVPAGPGALRAAALALALALHAVLEGLALGLREGEAAALRVLLALLLHKGAVAFGLSLELLRSRLRPPAVASCLVLLALMSPLGVGVGTALAAGAGPRQRLCRAVLEGLAAGTFLFVTFLEILPQELGAPRNRIPKVILILAGFALVSAILFVKG